MIITLINRTKQFLEHTLHLTPVETELILTNHVISVLNRSVKNNFSSFDVSEFDKISDITSYLNNFNHQSNSSSDLIIFDDLVNELQNLVVKLASDHPTQSKQIVDEYRQQITSLS